MQCVGEGLTRRTSDHSVLSRPGVTWPLLLRDLSKRPDVLDGLKHVEKKVVVSESLSSHVLVL